MSTFAGDQIVHYIAAEAVFVADIDANSSNIITSNQYLQLGSFLLLGNCKGSHIWQL